MIVVLLIVSLLVTGCDGIAEAAGCAVPNGRFEVHGIPRAGTCGELTRIIAIAPNAPTINNPMLSCSIAVTPSAPGSCTFKIDRACYLYDEAGERKAAERLNGTFTGSYHLYGDATLEMWGQDGLHRCRSVYEAVWWHQ